MRRTVGKFSVKRSLLGFGRPSLMTYTVYGDAPGVVVKRYHVGASELSQIRKQRFIPLKDIERNHKRTFKNGFEFLEFAKSHLGWWDSGGVNE